QHPLVAIFGAAKVKDKMPILKRFLKIADTTLLGGAIVFTFMKGMGYSTGTSLVEKESLPLVEPIAEEFGQRMLFPKDFVIAESPKEGIPTSTVEFHKIPQGKMGLDIGPKTADLFIKKLEGAKTVIWNARSASQKSLRSHREPENRRIHRQQARSCKHRRRRRHRKRPGTARTRRPLQPRLDRRGSKP
ncbi:MAG: phosphoglycerate kinase, partial [Nitrosarchaeum sp.]|nr:phosphoglycerate kinase [Nitrosarchaeum sp.]